MILLLVACGPGLPPGLGDDSAPPQEAGLGGHTAERPGPRNQRYHFVDLDLGWLGGCGLTDEGEIVCWGDSDYGILDAPSGVFSSISVGPSAGCALEADGVVTCWGQSSPFAGAFEGQPPFRQVAVGYTQLCALTVDGGVLCWGDDEFGETLAPAGGFAAVDVGVWLSCGLDPSGVITCWGRDDYGQTDARAERFSSISVATREVCGVEAETGLFVRWGADDVINGYVLAGDTVQAACNSKNACALMSDGVVWCWGERHTESWPGPYTRLAVDAGSLACGLRDTGSIDCWYGSNDGFAESNGALDVPY